MAHYQGEPPLKWYNNYMSTKEYIINTAIVIVMLGIVFYISFFSERSKEINAPETTKVEVPQMTRCAAVDCKKGA